MLCGAHSSPSLVQVLLPQVAQNKDTWHFIHEVEVERHPQVLYWFSCANPTSPKTPRGCSGNNQISIIRVQNLRSNCDMSRALARGALIYLGAVNLGAAALFGYDKMQAARGAWRVPERTLCQSATLGGWPGGFVAMQTFRHKTRKKVRQPACYSP